MLEVVSSKGVEELDWDDEREDEKRKKAKDHQSNINNNKDSSMSDKNNNSTPVLNSEDSITTKKNDTTTTTSSTAVATTTTTKKKKKDPMSDIDKLRESYKGNLFLSLEYISHDLTGLLDMAYKFSEVQVKSIAQQLLQVLEFMHERNFVHRDLKVCCVFL